nr:hypothetical protein [uncultured Psychroserpens sp.]
MSIPVFSDEESFFTKSVDFVENKYTYLREIDKSELKRLAYIKDHDKNRLLIQKNNENEVCYVFKIHVESIELDLIVGDLLFLINQLHVLYYEKKFIICKSPYINYEIALFLSNTYFSLKFKEEYENKEKLRLIYPFDKISKPISEQNIIYIYLRYFMSNKLKPIDVNYNSGINLKKLFFVEDGELIIGNFVFQTLLFVNTLSIKRVFEEYLNDYYSLSIYTLFLYYCNISEEEIENKLQLVVANKTIISNSITKELDYLFETGLIKSDYIQNVFSSHVDNSMDEIKDLSKSLQDLLFTAKKDNFKMKQLQEKSYWLGIPSQSKVDIGLFSLWHNNLNYFYPKKRNETLTKVYISMLRFQPTMNENQIRLMDDKLFKPIINNGNDDTVKELLILGLANNNTRIIDNILIEDYESPSKNISANFLSYVCDKRNNGDKSIEKSVTNFSIRLKDKALKFDQNIDMGTYKNYLIALKNSVSIEKKSILKPEIENIDETITAIACSTEKTDECLSIYEGHYHDKIKNKFNNG